MTKKREKPQEYKIFFPETVSDWSQKAHDSEETVIDDPIKGQSAEIMIIDDPEWEIASDAQVKARVEWLEKMGFPALPYRTGVIDADEMRLICENCGYSIFRVDKIRSQTIVDMQCPKCGHQNRATFTPPQSPHHLKGQNNGTSIPHLGGLPRYSQRTGSEIYGQALTLRPRGINHLGVFKLWARTPQKLSRRQVQPQRLSVQERRDADGAALRRTRHRTGDHLARTGRPEFQRPAQLQAENPLAGQDRGNRRSVLSPTRIYPHLAGDGATAGASRLRTGRSCWYADCCHPVTSVAIVSRPLDGNVQILAELPMCVEHSMDYETLSQLPLFQAINVDGLMTLEVETIET